jgi:hypothetical protein
VTPDFECTLWPEGWWQACCIAHDLGQIEDIDFVWCVARTAPNQALAAIGAFIGFVMFVGLKLLGPTYRKWARRT